MNDTHDFTHDEADPFEALLKRADALQAHDDIGLEAVAKEAIEAKTPEARLDKLRRVIAKAVGFSLPAVKKAFDEVRAKLDRESQAKKQADPSVAAAEAAARQAALDAEKAAREAEHERLWQSCKGIALAPDLLNRMALLARQAGVIGEVSAIKGTYIVVTSRLMRSDAISLLRRGSASAGKSLFARTCHRAYPTRESHHRHRRLCNRAGLFRRPRRQPQRQSNFDPRGCSDRRA